MATASFASGVGCAANLDALTPEAFGARGDGRTNDTEAFAALSDYVNARRGGTVVLRPVTYIVGGYLERARDDRNAKSAFPPAVILRFVNCTGDIIVLGNGATLRTAEGVRYGFFDPESGRPSKPESVAAQARLRASPYVAMVHVEGCSGLIDISDLELDGNLSGIQIGESGKHGRQMPATGIRLADNSGLERLSRIYTHHHPLDGLTIFRPLSLRSSTVVTDLRSEFNGRQGCSVTGGRNFVFERCRFSHTGKADIRSAPGAGVDIEAGRHPIRNLRFSECEFSNNSGPGIIAHSGDAEGAVFEKCTFVGTTSRAAWPNKPRMRFSDCVFVGSIVRAHGDPDPSRAVQFHDCTFTDHPALSPTGQIFGGRGRRQIIAQLPNNPNVLFNRCKFELRHEFLLPLSTRAVIYSDCDMSQRAPARSRPKGTYLGVNRLSGNVDLKDSVIRGEVILNGVRVPRNA